MNLKVQSMNQRKLVVKTLALYHLVKHICHRSPPTLRSRNQLLRRSSVSEIVPVTGFQYVSNRTEVIVTQRTICYCQQQAKRNDLLIEWGFCNEVYHGDCVSISPMMMVAAQSRKLKWGCTSCAAIRKIEDTKLENLKKGIKKIPTSSQVGGKKNKSSTIRRICQKRKPGGWSKICSKICKVISRSWNRFTFDVKVSRGWEALPRRS